MSYEKFAKMVAMKIIQFDEGGTISVLDRGMMIIATEMLIKFHELIEKDEGTAKADEMMFEAGRHQLVTGSPRYLERRNELRAMFPQAGQTGDPAIQMGKEAIAFLGMGNIQIREVSPDQSKIVLSTKNSAVALEYIKTRGKSARPVCHYIVGALAGVLEAIYKKPYAARELACMATGLSGECVWEYVRKD